MLSLAEGGSFHPVIGGCDCGVTELALQVSNLTVRYGENVAVEGISLSARRGEVVAIIGPSGCGKTTVLYCLAGLNQEFDGEVQILGNPPARGRRDLSIILQDYGLLPWKTAKENIELGLRFRGEDSSQVEALVERLGLTECLSRYPRQLSGGQKQRVAIARALSVEPRMLLMDEPFSALDALTREEMQELFSRVQRELQLTTVLITHSLEEALFLGNWIVVLSNSPAKVLSVIENSGVGKRNDPEHIARSESIRRLLAADRNEGVNNANV